MTDGKPAKTILISGASIAGPALAWWLSRFDFVPTLVERSPGPRPGGHAIDVRGVALDVLRAMGVEQATRGRRTRMKGVSILDADGKEVWRSEDMTISGGTFGTESIEILRDDMSDILMSALRDDIEIIYGDSIVALEEDSAGVIVSFEKSASRRFDLVVGADGIGSNIRGLSFGSNPAWLRPFGTALAPFSAPNFLGLKDWQLMFELGEERCIIYTARDNSELRVCFAFGAEFDEVPSDRPGQMALVKKRCGDWGWEVSRLLEAMEASPDFYLGATAQVKMDRWTQGRIALVGDAGYCPSPFTGQGTSVALVGAYVLANELSRSPADYTAAYDRYEANLRPFVAKNQALADIALGGPLSDAEYYAEVLEPATREAQDAIELQGL
jgi:2-polyprenyl-6-methoxyphenol hydroxylase-like FAD-dependent oxidoreductase